MVHEMTNPLIWSDFEIFFSILESVFTEILKA